MLRGKTKFSYNEVIRSSRELRVQVAQSWATANNLVLVNGDVPAGINDTNFIEFSDHHSTAAIGASAAGKNVYLVYNNVIDVHKRAPALLSV